MPLATEVDSTALQSFYSNPNIGLIFRNIFDGFQNVDESCGFRSCISSYWNVGFVAPNPAYNLGNPNQPVVGVVFHPQQVWSNEFGKKLEEYETVVIYPHDANGDKRALPQIDDKGQPYGWDFDAQHGDTVMPLDHLPTLKIEHGNPFKLGFDHGAGTGLHVDIINPDASFKQSFLHEWGKVCLGQDESGLFSAANYSSKSTGWVDFRDGFLKACEISRSKDCTWSQPMVFSDKSQSWQYLADYFSPWFFNPADCITISNLLWDYKNDWCEQSEWSWPDGKDKNKDTQQLRQSYWGWTEMFIPTNILQDCLAIVIVLPQAYTSIENYISNYPDPENGIADQLDGYWNKQYSNKKVFFASNTDVNGTGMKWTTSFLNTQNSTVTFTNANSTYFVNRDGTWRKK
jgi:hypothetical protein